MARPPLVVHYKAHGLQGLAFPCYYAELNVSIDSRKVIPKKLLPSGYFTPERTKHTIAMPVGHTDLRRVTCPKCWRAIADMAQAKGYR